jgi:hypothetical protein
MISPKFFALSVLLVCPFALARVQFHTQAELKNAAKQFNHSIDIVFQLDAHESLEVYNRDNLKVVAELLAEEEVTATVSFTISAKNAVGEYEKISAPVLVPNYTDSATISMGSSDGELFTMRVKAQKV